MAYLNFFIVLYGLIESIAAWTVDTLNSVLQHELSEICITEFTVLAVLYNATWV